MENSSIDCKLKDVKPLKSDKTYIVANAPKYSGLKLVNETVYNGGTSIRYWM